MTSEKEERQPLLRKLKDVSTNGANEQGEISRQNVRNLLVANGIVALVTIGKMLYVLNDTQYIYARIGSQMFGSNFSTPDRWVSY